MGQCSLLYSHCLLSDCLQSGSQACEGFREQMDTLIREAEEAEEVLKELDPVGLPEIILVQTRMEKLKVYKNVAWWLLYYLSVLKHLVHFHKRCVN